MVANIPRWRADGHTHLSQPSEQLRQLWSNVVDDAKPYNMYNLLPLHYFVTNGKTLLLFRLVSLFFFFF